MHIVKQELSHQEITLIDNWEYTSRLLLFPV